MKSMMSRPYSLYLDSLLTAKPRGFKYDLSGSTPPLPKIIAEFTPNYTEARKSKAWPALRKQLSKLYKKNENSFVITIGSSGAFFQALAAITRSGDSVFIERPTYEPFIKAALFLNLKIQRFDRTDSFEKDLLVLKKKKPRILVLSNPLSPTGHLYTENELKQLAKLVDYLVVDEVFLPVFTGELTRCASIKNAIIISGLSKTLGLSSLRIGWISALNPEILRAAEQVAVNLHIDLPTLPLVAACENLKNWKTIIRDHRAAAEKNRKLLRNFDLQYPGVFSHDFKFGHFATMQIPKKFKTAAAFAEELASHSIKVCPCATFELPRSVRISAMLPPEKFKAAFSVIASFY